MANTTFNIKEKENHVVYAQGESANDARYYAGIDWASLIFRLLENIHWILITAFICAGTTGLYVKSYVTPIYQATSKIYIAGSEATISLSDIQLGSSLTTDYQEAFSIWHVHEMVDTQLGLDYSYDKLAGMISVYNPNGSHILYINAKSADPEEAKLLADTYAKVVQEFIAEKMELRRPQLIQVAQTPTRPVSPDIKSDIIKAFLFGAFLAAAFIIFLYLLDDKIRTSDDIERTTGLATLGILMKQEQNNKNTLNTDRSQDTPLGQGAEIQSDLSLGYASDEAINTICSAVMFTGKDVKRIAITSHEANEGKTFISIRIAHSMADRGKKTLLIDGDLRKASVTGQYRIRHTSKGLAHLLSGQCALEEAIYSTNIQNLFLLPAGESIKTPLPLLTSDDFEKLMEELKSEFDLIIVDTPPVGVVIDAAEIAKRCDGSLLVLEYNRQTKGTLRYMKRVMEQTQTPVIGCVINKFVMKKLTQKRYYYQYSGNYNYYSDKTDEIKKSVPRSKGRRN